MSSIKIEIGETAANTAKPFLGLTADQAEQVEREAQAEWGRNASERAAFGDNFGAYLAYRKAQKAGMVKTTGRRHV